MGLLLPLITLYNILLTFLYLLLLFEKMLNEFLFFDPLLFLVSFLEGLWLGWLLILKHAHEISKSII